MQMREDALTSQPMGIKCHTKSRIVVMLEDRGDLCGVPDGLPKPCHMTRKMYRVARNKILARMTCTRVHHVSCIVDEDQLLRRRMPEHLPSPVDEQACRLEVGNEPRRPS